MNHYKLRKVNQMSLKYSESHENIRFNYLNSLISFLMDQLILYSITLSLPKEIFRTELDIFDTELYFSPQKKRQVCLTLIVGKISEKGQGTCLQ